MDKIIIKGPGGEDIYKEDWTDEFGNVVKDGKVLAACGEWFDINPWKNEEIANAPMDKWFSMDEVWKIKNKSKNVGKYWMNKKGEVKAIRSPHIKDEEKKYIFWGPKDYYINKSGSRKKRYMTLCDATIHSLYALMFLKNDDPENKIVVDHINGDSFNNSHINLRWSTKKENSTNIDLVSRKKQRKSINYFAKFDKKGNFIEWVSREFLTRNYSDHLNWALRDSNSFRAEYNGFLWEKYTDVAKEYIEKYGFPSPNEWNKSKDFENILANSSGCILMNLGTAKAIISVGSKEGDYYRVAIGKIKIQTNRLIWCIKNNKHIKEIDGLVIDHINTDSFDNRIENLRSATYSENMWNEDTRKKLWTRVSQINPEDGTIVKIHDSMAYAGFELGARHRGGGIARSILHPHKTFAGFIWSHVGDERERWENYIKHLETSKQMGKVPKWFWKDKEHRRKLAIKCKTINKYKTSINGYVYDISSSIPGELDEFFPEISENKNID